jgi:hypothetical protein
LFNQSFFPKLNIVLPTALKNTFKEMSLVEKPEFNQYWYSDSTIKRILSAIAEPILQVDGTFRAPRCAFIATPSLFFSLSSDERHRCNHAVLDIDEDQFAKTGGAAFVKYDFRLQPPADHLPKELEHAFDIVVIDPPFITEEVWRLFASSANFLLRGDGKGRIICTTVAENLSLLVELFPGITRTKFQPSIPHLVYQYDLFCNWEATSFSELNPEIPLD